MRYLILLLAVGLMAGCAATLTEQQWQEELKSADAMQLCKNHHNTFRKALNSDRSKYSLEEIQRRGIDCDKEFEAVATKGRRGIDPEQIRISALYLCGAAGFKLGTESHSHCMMSEMQRQLEAINLDMAQRRAWGAVIWSNYLHNINHSYYHPSHHY